MSTIKSSSANLTLNADGANNDIKFQSNGAEVASIDQAGTIQINGNLKGKSDNTTELGNPYNVGGIKRLRMVQGGEIHFGDTTTSNFFGITEGTVNQFADVDVMSLYFRNRLDLYASNNSKRLRIDGDGIKFNTDTAAANALDDYEEGAWSPTITGASGSYGLDGGANTAAYTKIGRLVTCQGHLGISSDNSASGNLKMSLPFTPASLGDDQEYAFAHLHLANTGTTTAGQKQLFILAGGAYLHNVTDGGVASYLTHAAVDANWQMGFSFSYIAA